MGRVKELARNTLILTIGRISTQLITFLLLPLYTGLLSTEEYGMVDLVNTLVMVFTPIISLQIDQGTFRMLVDNRKSGEQVSEVVTNSMSLVGLGSAIFLAIGLPLAVFIGGAQWYFFICIVIATVFTNLLLQIARGLDQTTEYAFASFIIALFTIIFNIIFLLIFMMGVNGMLMGTFLGHFIGYIYLLTKLNIKRYLHHTLISQKIICNLLLFSVPLIPSSISWWVFHSSDRVIVSAILGLSMNGILSASTKFSGAFIAVYNIFVLSWTESICVHINDNDIQEFFSKIFSMALRIFYSAALVLLSIIPFIYDIMINHRYSDGYGLVPLHLITSLLNIVLGLLGAVYIAKKDTKTVAVTSVLSAIINIAVNLLLIRFIGLYASPISTIIALAVMIFVRNKDLTHKYYKIKYDIKPILLATISLTIIMIFYYQKSTLLHMIGVTIALANLIYICQDIILKAIAEMKNMLGGKEC